MAIRQPDTIISNNPKAYGIVKAKEVSGHKTVQCLDELYKIPDCILSESRNNSNNDAVGQEWYVISEERKYILVDWNNRDNSLGWKIDKSDITVDSILSQESSNPIQNSTVTDKFLELEESIDSINNQLGEIGDELEKLNSIKL